MLRTRCQKNMAERLALIASTEKFGFWVQAALRGCYGWLSSLRSVCRLWLQSPRIHISRLVSGVENVESISCRADVPGFEPQADGNVGIRLERPISGDFRRKILGGREKTRRAMAVIACTWSARVRATGRLVRKPHGCATWHLKQAGCRVPGRFAGPTLRCLPVQRVAAAGFWHRAADTALQATGAGLGAVIAISLRK